MPAEFINIYGFIVFWNIFEYKLAARDEIQYLVLAVHPDHSSVHPVFIFVDQCKRLSLIFQKRRQDAVLKDQITFQKQGIFFDKIILCQRQ